MPATNVSMRTPGFPGAPAWPRSSTGTNTTLRDDLLQAPPPHFWEIVDQGRNLHYLKDVERAQLDRFLGWLGAT